MNIADIAYEKLFDSLPKVAQDDFIKILWACESALPNVPQKIKEESRLLCLSFYTSGFFKRQDVHVAEPIDLTLSVDVLNLTVRSANVLYVNDIFSLKQLISLTRFDVLKLPNLGRKSLIEIESSLFNLGLTFSLKQK
jgi:DNA-directed RNA polymerase alpha subunit